MKPIAFDTETALIRPALLAPPMTCLTWCGGLGEPSIVHVDDAFGTLKVLLRDPNVLLAGHFAAFDSAVICAEFPDLIPLVFRAYREGRITCTKKRQQLLDIAGGVFRGRFGQGGKWITHKYGLEDLARRHLGRNMVKDGWRLQYANFRDVPLSQWPARAVEIQAVSRVRRAQLPPPGEVAKALREWEKAGATAEQIEAIEKEIKGLDAIVADVPEGVIRYPLEDADVTLGVFLSQEKHAEYLKDQFRQSYADFVLYLSSAWGLRTHGPGVEALRAELAEAYDELSADLQALGMVREDGTRDMKVIKAAMVEACREYGLPLRRTDAHAKCDAGDACADHISLDADACEAVVLAATAQGGNITDDDSPFMLYAEFSAISKMLKNDCKMLEQGTVYPVHTRYDLAETGRTTSAQPNIQNLNAGRVKNEKSQAQRLRKGVRQAFVPRTGKVFFQADFPQLELYTLAQCCYSWLGYSKLGEALNAGLDPHMSVAAQILGITYEEAEANKKRKDVDHARQIGKVFNFGKPGGLGAKKLILFARKTYGVTMTLEKVEEYTAQWHAAFPEMRAYFARVNALFGDENDRCSVETLFTERHRGGATYCAACNNGFQALGVDCAKAALCLIGEAEYVGTPSAEWASLHPGTPSPLFGSRSVAFVHDEVIGETADGPGAHDVAMENARLMMDGANRYLPNVPITWKKMRPSATLMRRWDKDAAQVFDAAGRLVPWAG